MHYSIYHICRVIDSFFFKKNKYRLAPCREMCLEGTIPNENDAETK